MLAMAGGEPFQFTTLPRGAGNPQWSPDGKMILFYNSATAEELAKGRTQRTHSRQREPERESDSAGTRKRRARDQSRRLSRERRRLSRLQTSATHLGRHRSKTGDEKVTPKQLTSGHFDDGGAFGPKTARASTSSLTTQTNLITNCRARYLLDRRHRRRAVKTDFVRHGRGRIHSVPTASSSPSSLQSASRCVLIHNRISG
jgi:hypothetical protein